MPDFMTGYLAFAGVNAVTQLFNGWRQRSHQSSLEELRYERQQKEQKQKSQHSKLQDQEAYKRFREQLDANERLARESEENRWRHTWLDRTYPSLGGPGFLRDLLRDSFPELVADEIAPVVLIQPMLDEANGNAWANARLETQAKLSRYDREGFLTVLPGLPERPFHWPFPSFYEHDLKGTPTIIVQPTAAPSGVNIWMGGCHLVPSPISPWPIHRMQHVMMLRHEDMTKADPTQKRFDKTTGTVVDVPVRRKINDSRSRQTEMQEYLARALEVCTVYAMDCYHLAHRMAYDQRLDELIEDEELASISWEQLTPLSTDIVRDRAYHLLSQSQRAVRAGDDDLAERLFYEAFGQFENRPTFQLLDDHEIRNLLTRLSSADNATTNPWSKHLDLAYRVIQALPADSQPAQQLLPVFHQEVKKVKRLRRGQTI